MSQGDRGGRHYLVEYSAGETRKREGEGGSAWARARGVREREREREREKHGIQGVFRGVAKLRVITARGSVSAVRVQSIKELRPARNCLGFILLGTGCAEATHVVNVYPSILRILFTRLPRGQWSRHHHLSSPSSLPHLSSPTQYPCV